MRILFIASNFPHPNEPTRAVFNLNLARGLAAKHEIKVIAPVPWLNRWAKGQKSEASEGRDGHRIVEGIDVYHPTFYYSPKLFREYYGWFFWHSIRSTVWRILRFYTPDAVIGYWIHPDGDAAVRVAEIVGVPSAILVGGSDLLLLPLHEGRRRCIKNTLLRADAVLTVSDDLRAKAIEMGIDASKVHPYRQGVDTAYFAPGDQQQARRKIGVSLDAPMLLWVGRIVPVKAIEILIDACKALHARGVRFQLCLVGDGPLRGAMEARVATAGLRDCVLFAGAQPQDKLPDWYRAADLMVLPSWSEGLPNVLREAGACGTPFVASDVGGIPEIAETGRDLLVPAGDVTALADALAIGLSRQRPPMSISKSMSWAESADALVDVLRPLVIASQNKDHP